MTDRISLSYFGAANDGSACVTAAWNAMTAAAKASGKNISVPKGTYRFDSRPEKLDFCAHWIGAGQSNTGAMLIKNYAEAVSDNGMIEFAPGADGTRFGGFFIKNQLGGGTLIAAKATADLTMTNLVLEDLNLSTLDNICPDYMVRFDGSLKATGAKGCRVNALRNVIMFGANYASAAFKGCDGLWWHGGGIYPAGSQSQYAGALAISGTACVPSAGIVIDIQTCNQIILTQCSGVNARFVSIGALGGVSISNDNTASYCCVSGLRSGSSQMNWANSSAVN
ncbi:hypothetical protein ACVMIH_000056 [Bradyrhizobium sp. USDA 4503]